jgi:hypothetical protein
VDGHDWRLRAPHRRTITITTEGGSVLCGYALAPKLKRGPLTPYKFIGPSFYRPMSVVVVPSWPPCSPDLQQPARELLQRTRTSASLIRLLPPLW